MTHHCLLLDDYLDGRLSETDAEAFEVHALDCDVCDDALALPEEITDGLRGLADCPCPPEVLDAALRTSHRAPDRAAVAGRTRRRLWAAPVALAALAIALVVVLPPPPPAVQPPTVITEVTRPEALPSLTTVTPEPTDAVAEVTPDAALPTSTASRPTVRPQRASTPSRTARTVPEATAPTGEPAPTAAEVEEATRELALAFRLVADAQTDARRALREEAGGLSTAIDTALPF